MLVLLSMSITIALFLYVRCSIEGRRVTANNMAPTLNLGERVLFDLSCYRNGEPFKRGQIILFYPPYVHVRTNDIDKSLIGVLDRAFAPPSLHPPESSIKRIIGVPGDTIEVKRDVGVFVNGVQLPEHYASEPANYDLKTASDIGGPLLSSKGEVHPYPGKLAPIVVPTDSLFVLGDNRNHSQDSHIWGFLKQNRVEGKALLVFYPRLQIVSNQ